MKLAKPKSINSNPLLPAFLLPFVSMLMLMLISGCEPFGEKTFLYSDAWHQYYPFFLDFRRALLSGDSLLYNWDLGMGMDYLGLISYYLASPLYLLSVLVPEGLLLEYFNLLHPVRLGLASLFFAIFLKEIFRREDLSVAVFGGFYAFCAWAMGYRWNVMWVDTFALLPLVVLGTVKLLREKKFFLYTLTLFLAVYSNYYIGFFVCIFVALVFLCYEICRWPGFGRFFADLGRIALFSLLAIGMTAFLELPAFAALQTTQSSVNNFPEGFRLNITDDDTWKGLLDAMRQVAGNLGGAIEPSWKEGLPNVACGVFTIMLCWLYLLSGQVKLRDKICAVVLLIFLNVSFIIRQLDYIWHGFHFTNMIPYRFSFLYSFVMLYMAYRAWTLRERFSMLQLALAGVLTAGILACSNDLLATVDVKLASKTLEVPVYLIYNVSFLALYLGTMLYGAYSRKIPEDATERTAFREEILIQHRRAAAGWVLTGIMVAEIILTLVNFGTTVSFTRISNYPKGTTYTASMIKYMHEREEDNPFFRAEMSHSQTLNDDALNGYSGVSAFTSSANVRVTVFMKALGYGAKNTYNRYCWEEASPVSNLFLNLKYMIERDDRNRASSVFTDLHSYGNTHLLENNAYLPLGFLTEMELAEVDFFAGLNVFNIQNIIFTGATGIRENVWRLLNGPDLIVTGENVTILDSTTSGYTSYSDAGSSATITYTYIVDRDGFFCVNVDLPKRNDVSIRLNGEPVYNETTSLAQMMAVGDVVAGDMVEITMDCDPNEKGTMTLTGAVMDMDIFWQGYELLARSTMEITSFRNTCLEGTVDCDREGLLYTSIPYDGNWSVTVDGEPAEILLVGDCMIAVALAQGRHELVFRYENKAFSLGWKISLGCLCVFLVLVWLNYQPQIRALTAPRRRKGKFQK